MLGNTAPPESVAVLNEELGLDRSVFVRYVDWISGVAQGDLGESYSQRRPVSDIVGPALENSAKLAILAFFLVVPLAIVGGAIAALNEGRFRDRFISVGGLSAAVVPEFVWAVLVIVVFAPLARHPAGDGPSARWSEHLHRDQISPPPRALSRLRPVRLHRAHDPRRDDRDAGLRLHANSDPEGLPRRAVLRKHVLRNSLLPTIAVIATQTGYLIGGLVVIELIFNYQGIGQVLFRAAERKDFPLLQSAVLVVGIVYLVATLIADILYSILNPRIRLATEP